jgi:multicomponent Na+:H+ antiporter subunit G
MISFQHIAAMVIVGAGAFFLLVGSIGVVRLPDFYARTHATTKSDTLGIMLVLGGLAVYEGLTENSLKLLIAIVFVALANPVGSHALARAAFRYGLKPWFLKGDHKESRTRRS